MSQPADTPAPLGLSRAQIARNLGISETEVRRIEARALLKARAALERQGLSFRQILALLTPNQTDQ